MKLYVLGFITPFALVLGVMAFVAIKQRLFPRVGLCNTERSILKAFRRD